MSGGASVAQTRTLVAKYELGKSLGEGTFAKVKFAPNTHTGDCVAIKIIDRHQVLHHKMIKREISTMKMIRHPNVLNLFEATYGKLKEDAARRYFQQLINAVDYCHSRGVYHRDLKEDGLLHTACGTPNYVAPEVLTDKGYDGTSSDIWSCGVVLFVLMAGYLPFNEPNLVALYRRIQKADFSFPSWFSSSAKMLIKLILDPNPLTRMTIPEILENDWFRKDYKPPNVEQGEDVSLDDVDAVFNDSEEHLVTERKEKPVSMNAFELTSRSQGVSVLKIYSTSRRYISSAVLCFPPFGSC